MTDELQRLRVRSGIVEHGEVPLNTGAGTGMTQPTELMTALERMGTPYARELVDVAKAGHNMTQAEMWTRLARAYLSLGR